jgi:RND superfamily putative drug exporter
MSLRRDDDARDAARKAGMRHASTSGRGKSKWSVMARLLQSLGTFSAAHRIKVIVAWALLLVTTGIVALVGLRFSDTGFEIPGSESSTALQTVEEQFGQTDQDEGRGTLQLVIKAPDNQELTTPQNIDAVSGWIKKASDLEHVTEVSDPFDPAAPYVSKDGTTAVATVTYGDIGDTTAAAATDTLDELAGEIRAAGFAAEVGGSILSPIPQIFGISEVIGAAIAFLVLLVTFGSMLAAGANMLSALVGVGVGVLGILATSALSPLGSTTPILAAMLGLAVGIDYALFVVARYRAELREGRSVRQAVALATGTAGTAVVFAGATVIIALAGLALVNIPFVTEMGLAGAAGVLVAVLASITLLPAMLSLIGARALPRKERTTGHAADVAQRDRTSKFGFFERWAALVVRRPLLSLIAGVALLCSLSVPVLSLSTALSVPGGEEADTTQRRAYELISDEFGAGAQSPLLVLVEGSDVASNLPGIADDLSDLDGVDLAVPGEVTANDRHGLITVITDSGPMDDATRQVVDDIRTEFASHGDANVAVTGQTAIGIDTDTRLSEALGLYLVLIVSLAIVLMMVLFRSLLVPVAATIGYLLSLGAALGMTVAVFQWGWLDTVIQAPQGNPLMSLLPLLVVGILFGLAMDYQVFLVSRIHEAHAKGLSPKEAILDGFGRSAFVVAAAAVIMLAVFGGFSLSHSSIVASIAFALAVGVLADAFIVRMVLMPAVLSLAGRAGWWIPRWLDRALPRIDAEGATLDVPAPAPASPVLAGVR